MNDSSRIDPYALPPDAIQEPPRTLLKALGQIGPGLILAASIVGTGELINTTSLGAKAGFSLLWLILLSCLIKVFVQVELGRYAITHGRTTLAAFDTLPGPRFGTSWLCWLWLFMMLATQAQIAAMEGTVGQAAHMAFPDASSAVASFAGHLSPAFGAFLATRQEHFWATLTTLAAIVLLLSGGYKRLERITTILVALVTLFTVASVLILQWTSFRISVANLKEGMELSVPPMAIALAFSAFGITGVGASELFAYPYWCIEKGYARAVGPRSPDQGWADRARGWTRVMQLDAWFSMVVFTVATIAFYLLGAAVLHPQGLDPKGPEMIPTLSRMYLQPLEGTALAGMRNWTRVGFLLGAWAVLFKTLYVATAANSRLTADFLDLSGVWRQNGVAARDRTVRAFCVIYPILALGLYFAFREPQGLIKIGGIAQSLLLPLIAGATLYLKQRDADNRVSASFLSDILTWVAFFAISAVAMYSTYILLKSFDYTGVRQLLPFSIG
ncbi:Mn2+ and Fe2+ transporters of the NRAMP family [Singulisphaera sp. GP187]|uniref:Nramp family divalent metal transporter n=1 Tax=Singulisphaera sp. GP187 TaxID=1882752 RepID=UPI0009268FC0|nr:Nramp family divalent metal transporter [Singulisphaera sp. GP187]SIO65335.1 Mn2+ and Fe2+ transporters of the NRAMP family [Singulisphaera sp. GP187]